MKDNKIEVYNPSKMSLDAYIESMPFLENEGPFPIFRGYEMFKRLRDGGYFMPAMSEVSLIFDPERDFADMNKLFGGYILTEDYKLEHEIDEKVHDPREVLAGNDWHARFIFPKSERHTKKMAEKTFNILMELFEGLQGGEGG